MNEIPLKGSRFGSWTVIGELPRGAKRWECKCECGKKKFATAPNIRRLAVNPPECICPHGGSETRLYKIWDGMKQRCQDINNKNYGAKGIGIQWEDFKDFKDWAEEYGYASNLTIERLDDNGDYSPGNCIWAAYNTQVKNRSSTVLDEDTVACIKAMYKYGFPNVGIAQMLSIPRQTICHVTSGRPI